MAIGHTSDGVPIKSLVLFLGFGHRSGSSSIPSPVKVPIFERSFVDGTRMDSCPDWSLFMKFIQFQIPFKTYTTRNVLVCLATILCSLSSFSSSLCVLTRRIFRRFRSKCALIFIIIPISFIFGYFNLSKINKITEKSQPIYIL